MTLKSYYGSTIREALNTARQELGVDAVVVTSRQTDPSEGLPGACEVVCGVLAGSSQDTSGTKVRQATVIKAGTVIKPGLTLKSTPPGPPSVKARPVEVPAPTPAPELPGRPSDKLREANAGLSQHLRRSVKTIRAVMSGNGESEPEITRLRTSLQMDGFEEELISELLNGVRQRLRPLHGDRNATAGEAADSALTAELDSRLQIEASLGRQHAPQRITALVGPPGVGKTSLIVKLAVLHGLRGNRPLRLITMDGARVGGADALRTYAAGMAVSIDVLETGVSLTQTIEAHSDAGLILIDTPGFSPADLPHATDLARALSSHRHIDVQLVLSASMAPSDMKATFARFRPFLPTRLAITNVDSSASCRSTTGLAIANEIPFSFLGTGQRIPEDIEEASAAVLLGRSTVRKGKTAVSAA